MNKDQIISIRIGYLMDLLKESYQYGYAHLEQKGFMEWAEKKLRGEL